MEFHIINGNDDYLNKTPEFAEEYNKGELSVPKLKEKLNLTNNEYRKLRKHCIEEGLITLKKKGRRKKQKTPKYYYMINRTGKPYYEIRKWGKFYCNTSTESQAKEIVRRLKKCNWDISQVDLIKKNVIDEIK